MNRENFDLVKRLFLRAAEISGEQQQLEFLDSQCSSADVRSEVLSLLQQQTQGFLDTPVQMESVLPPQPAAERVSGDYIGRHRLIRLLGEGGFAKVWLGHDEELDRPVAVKVAHARRFQTPRDAEAYLSEARFVARLDHPNIVPVYDVGRDDSGIVFTVSKFVEGTTLAEHLSGTPLDCKTTAAILVSVGRALAHAHERQLVHRDIKPSNILIERASGKAYLTDFGLAVNQEDFMPDGPVSGTPSYMSPEQARGEGHRLDHRSDIFSLGVVLYEALSGQKPFPGSTVDEVIHHVTSTEAVPLRDIDPSLPFELDRVCSKALSKRISDRYDTALEMVDDLLNWDQAPVGASREQLVVPKGLRSFDAGDATFFLELLPGPLGRDGMPESIRFWRNRIEQTDHEKTFNVGLIYGPSGCGKTSLVKAGLIPALSDRIRTFYVEASLNDTESRIMQGMQQVAEAPEAAKLGQLFSALRRNTNQKTLLILDQFEQWLHSPHNVADSELAVALRQCDGKNLQVILMIRDEFWMAAERFARFLDVTFQTDVNAQAVDLFSVDHAATVLTQFGRAYQRFAGTADQEHRKFIDTAVSQLEQNDRVVPVQLSLFGYMMRDKPWTPESLRTVGGAKAVGITFLEETFSSRAASPNHRFHESAAREVLKLLLPEATGHLRGRLRSRDALMEVSGYKSSSREFEELLRVLDNELKLITPVDPMTDGSDKGDEEEYYQLTHDYLVPVLQEWLNLKKQETWKGRAELRLEDRAAQWSRSRESRFLPGPLEYTAIQFAVPKRRRTDIQNKVIRAATRRYGVMLVSCLSAALLVGAGFVEINGRMRAATLVEAICSATPSELKSLISEALPPLRRWADRPLAAVARDDSAPAARRLHASLALVESNPDQRFYLKQRLLDCSVEQFGLVRSALRSCRDELTENLVQILNDKQRDAGTRFRAGLALADYGRHPDNWDEAELDYLVDQFVNSNPLQWGNLLDYLRPVKSELLDLLVTRFRDDKATDSVQKASATALSQYVEDSRLLARLLCEGTAVQHSILFPVLSRRLAPDDQTIPLLIHWTQQQSDNDFNETKRIALGKRRAGAAISLIRAGHVEESLEVLRVKDDLESVTQFVHGCRARGIRASQLLDLLNRAKTVTQRYAVLLALGEYSVDEIPDHSRSAWVDCIAGLYRDDPSSGIHSASGWLLRQWGYVKRANDLDIRDVPYSSGRQWFTRVAEISGQPQAYTFVVFEPGTYRIGSPSYELDRDFLKEPARAVRLTRPFAILDREITRLEVEALTSHQGFSNEPQWSKVPSSACGAIDWYQTALFCRALSEKFGFSELEQVYLDAEKLDPDDFPSDPGIRLRDSIGLPWNWPFRSNVSGVRLPTSAEYEIAARAGTITTYSHGCSTDLLQYYGWFNENSGKRGHGTRELRPNLRGLFDMHGNMYEWCHDWSVLQEGGYRPSIPKLLVDPMGPEQGRFRLILGGCFRHDASNARSAFRQETNPNYTYDHYGFRVAMWLPAGNAD